MEIKKAKVTQLSNPDRNENIEYHIECSNCGKEIDIRFGLKSNWSSYCSHCNELYNISWE